VRPLAPLISFGNLRSPALVVEVKLQLEEALVDRSTKKKEKKIDEAVDATFPASDPPASGKATGTESPGRPVDRKAPLITKEQIAEAQRGEGHKQGSR
jgi:hypothetical protein